MRPTLTGAVESLESRLLLTAGALDTTFGTSGVVTTDFKGPNPSVAYCTMVQTDGKIVSGGFSTTSAQGTVLAVSRVNADGSPDTTFGQGGQVTIPSIPTYNAVRSIVEQADGKILLGGDSSSNWLIVRLNANGTLDTTFGNNGSVITNYQVMPGQSGNHVGQGLVWGLAVQPNGSIVAAGQLNFGGTAGDNFAVARFLPNGGADTTFGTRGDGVVLNPMMGQSADGLAVVLQSDGRIIATGLATVSSGSGFEMAAERLNTDGSLDTTFGTGGSAYIQAGPNSQADSVALSPNGSIVLGGNSVYAQAAIARLTPSGQADTTFGGGAGFVLHQFGNGQTSYNSYANGIVVQTDGRIVAAGTALSSVVAEGLSRFNTDGTLDTTFGTNGDIVFNPLSTNVAANGVALQANGAIVTAGPSSGASLNNAYRNPGSGFFVARFTTSGQADTTFQGKGYTVTSFNGSQSDVGYAVAVQPDGKVLEAGTSSEVGGFGSFSVARYNANGTLDTTFGNGGEVIVAPFGLSVGQTNVKTILVQPDGRIVLAGIIYNPSYGFEYGVVRYNANGTLDTTFGNGGSVSLTFGGTDFLASAALTASGEIVLAGYDDAGPGYANSQFAVALLTTTGTLDPMFGTGGKTLVNIQDTAGNSSPSSNGGVVVQSDGKIVVVGSTRISGIDNYALVRLNTNGSLDTGFGTGGLTTTVVGGNSYAEGIGLSSTGQIYVAGSVGGNYTNHPYDGFSIALTRYTAAGKVDTTFGTNGSTIAPGGTLVRTGEGAQSQASGLVIQADGKVVVGGFGINYEGSETDFVADRFLTGGALDSTFGNAGTATYAIDPTFGNESASGMAIQPDNKILLAGYVAEGADGLDYALLRITGGAIAVTAPPTAILTGPTVSVPGQHQTYTLGATDTDPATLAAGFTYTVNFGDGTPSQTIAATAGNGSGVPVDHAYATDGSYTITLTATDSHGLVSTPVTLAVSVVSVALEPGPVAGQSILFVGGSIYNEAIDIEVAPKTTATDQYLVVIDTLKGCSLTEVVTTGTAAGHIVKVVGIGNGANDVITVESGPSVASYLFGGPGNNVLSGGDGNNVLVGGGGYNILFGGVGRSLLIAGTGPSGLFAGTGDAILIGGTTIFDVPTPAHLAAFDQIMAEWTSADTYANRVADLSGTGTGSTYAARLNGNTFLTASGGAAATVFDNGDSDLLVGGTGADWFLADLNTATADPDTVINTRKKEILTNIN